MNTPNTPPDCTDDCGTRESGPKPFGVEATRGFVGRIPLGMDGSSSEQIFDLLQETASYILAACDALDRKELDIEKLQTELRSSMSTRKDLFEAVLELREKLAVAEKRAWQAEREVRRLRTLPVELSILLDRAEKVERERDDLQRQLDEENQS